MSMINFDIKDIVLENRQNESFTCVHLSRASAYFMVIARSPLLETLPIRSFKPFDLLRLAYTLFKIFNFIMVDLKLYSLKSEKFEFNFFNVGPFNLSTRSGL